MKSLRTLTLLALLSAPFPLVAQQSAGHARVGTLTRIATVDVLNESASASPSVALAAPVVPRQRGARLLRPKNSAAGSAAQISRALAAGLSSQAQPAASTPIESAHSSSILHNFDGV